ncbi:MAG: A/G-specific adenine glycosylase [Oceanospirillaceae bacterium]|nr:A/G-specific adenine glycosylase [Oceanospirillaceae bacterium]
MSLETYSSEQFSGAVLSWFDQHGRHDLPWQQHKSAYLTWISEIMLQQTQVTTVIPYYRRFVEKFPDVYALAAADIDAVLHLWTGLGYYARARNLHKAALQIVNQYDGEFPLSVFELEGLSGIGKSTAGAILSISSNKRAAILDGNVKRVLARFYAVEGWSGKTAIAQQLWQHAEYNTPYSRPGDYTQAMMDMGATLCTRSKPKCEVCPIISGCAAKAQERVKEFPFSKPKKTIPVRQTLMLLIENAEGEKLLYQRPPSGLWGGLWGLPQLADLRDCASELQLEVDINSAIYLEPVRHTFSHFHLDITPVKVKLATDTEQIMEAVATLWYNTNKPANIGLAAPVKKLLEQY